jgi:hypothetical protein
VIFDLDDDDCFSAGALEVRGQRSGGVSARAGAGRELVVQGRKRTILGPNELRYGNDRYLITLMEVPW